MANTGQGSQSRARCLLTALALILLEGCSPRKVDPIVMTIHGDRYIVPRSRTAGYFDDETDFAEGLLIKADGFVVIYSSLADRQNIGVAAGTQKSRPAILRGYSLEQLTAELVDGHWILCRKMSVLNACGATFTAGNATWSINFVEYRTRLGFRPDATPANRAFFRSARKSDVDFMVRKAKMMLRSFRK